MIASSLNSIRLLCLLVMLLLVREAHGASPWEKPAVNLADRVAEILGPGQAQLTVTNRSSVSAGDVPSIRRLVEQELRARGVQIGGAESANQIRITLSESDRQRLWVAEIVEGSQTRFVMVPFALDGATAPRHETAIILTRKTLWSSVASTHAAMSPVLAALETPSSLVLLEQDAIVILVNSDSGWQQQKRIDLDRAPSLSHGQIQSRGRIPSRDPRGMLLPSETGFTAYTAGMLCEGSYASAGGAQAADWTIQCHESDDPWPVNASNLTADSARLKAFFNAGRNFYTGLLTPSLNANISPFFTIAVLPGPELIFGGIDGKVQMLDGNSLKPITGTRDWGSDFAAIRTGCGSGSQIVATSSGEAESDSVRAYELFAQEAVAASAPLELGGTVTALWTAPDGASALAVIRRSPAEYEVDRVAALCP